VLLFSSDAFRILEKGFSIFPPFFVRDLSYVILKEWVSSLPYVISLSALAAVFLAYFGLSAKRLL